MNGIEDSNWHDDASVMIDDDFSVNGALICILKMNVGLTALEQHKGE